MRTLSHTLIDAPLSHQEAAINMIVATEVLCWFFVGECIGKRSLVGYKV